MDTIKSSYYESKMDCYCECYFQLKYSGPVDVTELSLTLLCVCGYWDKMYPTETSGDGFWKI